MISVQRFASASVARAASQALAGRRLSIDRAANLPTRCAHDCASSPAIDRATATDDFIFCFAAKAGATTENAFIESIVSKVWRYVVAAENACDRDFGCNANAHAHQSTLVDGLHARRLLERTPVPIAQPRR